MAPRRKWPHAPEARPLNPQQQRFVEHYLVLGNGKEAAIHAGYSARSAPAIAVRLKRLANVGEAIRRGRAQQAEDARIDAARVLAELGRIAFSDIGRIAEWDSDGVALKSNAEIAEADRASIAELAASAGDKSRSARIRLHNKQRALDGIARLLGLYGRGARLPYADPQERMAAAESARAKLRARIEALAAAQRREEDKAVDAKKDLSSP